VRTVPIKNFYNCLFSVIVYRCIVTIHIKYNRREKPKELIRMLELEQFKQEIESLGKDIREMGASL